MAKGCTKYANTIQYSEIYKLQTTSNNNASSVIVHAAVSRLNAALLQLLRYGLQVVFLYISSGFYRCGCCAC